MARLNDVFRRNQLGAWVSRLFCFHVALNKELGDLDEIYSGGFST